MGFRGLIMARIASIPVRLSPTTIATSRIRAGLRTTEEQANTEALIIRIGFLYRGPSRLL